MNLPASFNQVRQAALEFWAARNARERRLLSAAAVLLALGLIYAVLLGPALAGRARLMKTLPELRQQVAQLQALSKEATGLSDQAAPVVASPSKENIEAALLTKGLKPQSVVLSGDLVKVRLSVAAFGSLLDWLATMQKTALLSVVDANIVALAQPGMVDATLTLKQQKNNE